VPTLNVRKTIAEHDIKLATMVGGPVHSNLFGHLPVLGAALWDEQRLLRMVFRVAVIRSCIHTIRGPHICLDVVVQDDTPLPSTRHV
jgi:hypothetical protein